MQPYVSERCTSWIDILDATPKSPLDLIAYAKIRNEVGVYQNSSTYLEPPPGKIWITNGFSLASDPVCTANATDNLQMVAEASQWNFGHLTRNSSSGLAIPMRKVIFLRGGLQWRNTIVIDWGATTTSDIQISFLGNAGTRGDFAGTVPVIAFTSTYSGTNPLHVTLKQYGRFVIGMRIAEAGGNFSMYEMEWVVVP